MEFGIFLNGYLPGPAAHQTELEHTMLFREAEYVIFADKHNWKYAWLGEHHSLTEYSHMSAPEVAMGYIAAQTDYIHLSTGINSLSPRKEHPVRYAERAAMLDHFTNNRFEWGTGRGAGSHEVASLQHHGQELHQGGVGRGRQGDPAHVGAGRLHVRGRTLHRAHAAQRAAEAVRQGTPADLGGVRQPAHLRARRRARASAPSPSTSNPSSTSGAASRPTRRASRSAPSPSVSSRTTT